MGDEDGKRSPDSVSEQSTGRVRRSDGEATRLRILDAAEAAFAVAPYDAVSLRAITTLAEVNLALVKYYFASKENLYTEVVLRRSEELCRTRLARLQDIPTEATPDVSAILRAYIGPLVEMVLSGDRGQYNYVAMLSFLSHERHFRVLIDDHFDPTLQVFFNALRDAMPGWNEEDIKIGLGFVLASMQRCLTERTRRPVLPDSTDAPGVDDMAKSYNLLIDFCSAGLERLGKPGRP